MLLVMQGSWALLLGMLFLQLGTWRGTKSTTNLGIEIGAKQGTKQHWLKQSTAGVVF